MGAETQCSKFIFFNMNRIFILISVAVLLMTTACNGIITMTTESAGVTLNIAGSGTFTVDWGDGTIEKHELLVYTDSDWEENCEFSREYSDKSSRTITITGKKITHFDCSSNQLTSLNVSKNKALTYLNSFFNHLTSLDVSKNTELTFLHCGFNQITNLDISKNVELEYLACQGNLLTDLDISKNIKLMYLYCSGNQLTELDLSKNTDMLFLFCRENLLTSLDVSLNTKLIYLVCFNNQLTSLDVSKNTELTAFECGENQLTSLDVSNNTKLTNLECRENYLTAAALNALFETLNDNAGGKSILIGDNPGTDDCDLSIATDKGWEVYTW